MDKIDTLFSGPAPVQAAEPAPAGPRQPQPADTPRPDASGPKRDADSVDIAAIFPSRHIRLVIDAATGIVQAQIRDAATGRVLRELPDDDWLRESAVLREFARQAIVDKSV